MHDSCFAERKSVQKDFYLLLNVRDLFRIQKNCKQFIMNNIIFFTASL